jgi:hypothetical protein
MRRAPRPPHCTEWPPRVSGTPSSPRFQPKCQLGALAAQLPNLPDYAPQFDHVRCSLCRGRRHVRRSIATALGHVALFMSFDAFDQAWRGMRHHGIVPSCLAAGLNGVGPRRVDSRARCVAVHDVVHALSPLLEFLAARRATRRSAPQAQRIPRGRHTPAYVCIEIQTTLEARGIFTDPPCEPTFVSAIERQRQPRGRMRPMPREADTGHDSVPAVTVRRTPRVERVARQQRASRCR